MVRSIFQDTTVLYIEPELILSDQVSKILRTFFKKVIIATSGEDAYNIFISDYSTLKEIGLIITEIKLPNKNGLDVIKNIKNISSNVPFIVLSDQSESKYMIEAIKLGVSHYVLKPIEPIELLKQLEDSCTNIFQTQKLSNKEKELQEYINIVDKVAIVSTTDTKGIITYVNDIFCKTSQYTKDELIGHSHNIIRHPDNSKETFKELWSTIQNGNTWRGKLKNRAKDGSVYYVDSNIFPLFYDDNKTIKGYMGVRFLTTDIEIEKRNFKQKVLQNLIQQKSIICAYEESINNLKIENNYLQTKISQFENVDILHDKIQKEKSKNSRLMSQLESYEKQFETFINKNQEIVKKAKASELKAVDELKQIKVKYESAKIVMQNQQIELSKKENVIFSLQTRLEEYLKVIDNLKDVIKFKESQEKQPIQKEEVFYYDNI